MATLLPKWHSKRDTRRRPNDGRCKKHPKHQQSPGVCSVCLTEKLSHLNNPTPSRRAAATARLSHGGSSTTSSLSSYYSSSGGSSCSTPLHQKVTLSSLLSGGGRTGKDVLRKSRSLAFVPRSTRANNGNRDIVVDRNEKRKIGFWSKLFKRKRSSVRESDAKFMQHSRTVRERSSVRETL